MSRSKVKKTALNRMHQKQAISATVTGDDQQVSFRAMVMKQAIEYNLAGSAKNERNQVVKLTLQGDANRLDLAVAAIREGTKKSSNIDVITTQAAIAPLWTPLQSLIGLRLAEVSQTPILSSLSLGLMIK